MAIMTASHIFSGLSAMGKLEAASDLAQTISEALFTPQGGQELPSIGDRPPTPYLELESEEQFEALADDRGWGDGFPLRAPTQERLETMLDSVRGDPERLVAVVPPRMGRMSLRYLATNAIMAGCSAEALPTLCTAVQAACDPLFQLGLLLSTTSPTTTLVIVNGPVVRHLGLNSTTRAMGAGCRANATLGRAVRLTLRNAGGEAGVTGKSTLGQPGDYSFCFAENEMESPWPPLSVEQGIPEGQSAVTVVPATGVCEIRDSASTEPEDLLFTLSQSLVLAGLVGPSGTAMINGHLTLVLCPEHARIFGKGGLSREAVQRWIWGHSHVRADMLSPANRLKLQMTRASCGLPASFDQLPITKSPNDILIVVAGGVGAKSAYIPGWGSSQAVTYPIVDL